MKKENILILFVCMSLFCINFALAQLDVTVKTISDSVIIDLDEPAEFELILRNLGETDVFEIYSLADVELSVVDPINITSGEAKSIILKIMPGTSLVRKTGFLAVRYKIKDSQNNIQEDVLTVNILELGENTFDIIPGNINPQSSEVRIVIENKINRDFSDLNLKLSSAFFDAKKDLPLAAKEIKEVVLPINTEKLKTMSAGSFLMTVQIGTEGKFATIEKMIKFLEQADLDVSDKESGTIISKEEHVRKNVGNTKKDIKITTKRNLISSMFTTYNIEPTKTYFTGFATKNYEWEKQLIPNEEYRLLVKTNWYYPLIILILVVVILYMVKRSVDKDLSVRKNVSFVRTKGGEFALKVSLRIHAKRYIERVNISDKIPPLVNLYRKFGAISPSRIDMHNRRIEWNVEVLGKGEERVFTYIIYSKIGVVGRFELPEARAMYEKNGKIKQTESNRSFYINERD